MLKEEVLNLLSGSSCPVSGEEVARLFGDAGVFKFLEDFGDTLHCQSDEATIAEIDDFIKA